MSCENDDSEKDIQIDVDISIFPELTNNEEHEINISINLVHFIFFNIFFDLVYLLVVNQIFIFYVIIIPSFLHLNTYRFNAGFLFIYNYILFMIGMFDLCVHIYLHETQFILLDIIYITIAKLPYLFEIYNKIILIH